MTKSDLVIKISESTGQPREQVMSIVESLMQEVQEANKQGENVYLRGFGTFEVVKRAEKTARIIHEDRTIIIPAHNAPKFKPAKSFKQLVKS